MKKRWLLAAAVLVISIFVWQKKSVRPSAAGYGRVKPISQVSPANKAVVKKEAPSQTITPKVSTSNQTPASTQPTADQGVSQEEREYAALQTLSQTLFVYSKYYLSAEKFGDQMKKLGLKPIISNWSNEETGKMFIARTKNTLPGTRYIHAQFFEDDIQRPYMQHMSFEFRPSPDAMDDAIKSVESAFGRSLSHRVKNEQGYVMWNTDNGYIVWVKKLELEDLRDNPFNAYTKADVGTIRITVEQEIHGDEHGYMHNGQNHEN